MNSSFISKQCTGLSLHRKTFCVLVLAAMNLRGEENAFHANRQIWDSEKQAEMEEFSRQSHIEYQEAVKKGSQAVYEIRLKWTKEWAERARKTKSLDQINIFNKIADDTLKAWEETWEYQYGEKLKKENTTNSNIKIKEELEKAKKQEAANLESLIDYSTYLTALTDPSTAVPLDKSGTSKRTVNNLLLACIYYLAQAKMKGDDLTKLMDQVNRDNGIFDKPEGEILKISLLANLKQAEHFGILNQEGLALLKQWECPVISVGEKSGIKVKPSLVLNSKELENKIYNYELKPEQTTSIRMASLTPEAKAFADSLKKAGLLSENEYVRIQQEGTPASNLLNTEDSKAKIQESLKEKVYREEDAKWADEYKNPNGIGAQEFYEIWRERAQKQAEIANETRNEEDILRFQNYVERTLQFYGGLLMLQSSKEFKDKKIRVGNEDLKQARLKEEIEIKREEEILNSLLKIKAANAQSSTNSQ